MSLKSFYPRPVPTQRSSRWNGLPPKNPARTVADLEAAVGGEAAPQTPKPEEQRPLAERLMNPCAVYVPDREKDGDGRWAYFHRLDVERSMAQNLSPEEARSQIARQMLTAELEKRAQRQTVPEFDYAAHFNSHE